MPRSKSSRVGYAGTSALFNGAGGKAHPAGMFRRFDGSTLLAERIPSAPCG